MVALLTRAFFRNQGSYKAVPQFCVCGTADFTPAT